jgi:hypothetical protein
MNNHIRWYVYCTSGLEPDFLLKIPFFNEPLPPLLYRPSVQRVMAVGIEPQTMPEARLTREVLFGHALEIVDEPEVGFIQLPLDIGERRVSFPFRHLRIEGIDAAKLDVSWWLASSEDQRQIRERLLLPGGHVCKDIFDRPLAHDARLHQLWF